MIEPMPFPVVCQQVFTSSKMLGLLSTGLDGDQDLLLQAITPKAFMTQRAIKVPHPATLYLNRLNDILPNNPPI